MLTEYIHAGMHHARFEILPEDGDFYGEIPECNGVFANADPREKCREQLEEVLGGWILLRLHRDLPLQVIGAAESVIQKVA